MDKPADKFLVILRGVSGSGKTTYVNRLIKKAHGLCKILSSQVCSADYYFERPDKVYDFNPKLLPNAHAWCLKQVKLAMEDFDAVSFTGDTDLIIVDNTNICHWQYQKYIELAKERGYKVKIICIPFRKEDALLYATRNLHGVPLSSIKKMMDQFEY